MTASKIHISVLILTSLLMPIASAKDIPRDDNTLPHILKINNNFTSWQHLINDLSHSSSSTKIKTINDFINQHINWQTDMEVWHSTDYWATPEETLEKGAGDCEDISIAKYFSLLLAGEPVTKLRLVYVKYRKPDTYTNTEQSHMILAYYPDPDRPPLILDNIIKDIKSSADRTDLTPIFSFNSDGIYYGLEDIVSPAHLSRWQDVIRRARQQGLRY